MSFLDSWVGKSSAPALETAIAYVMSLKWVSFLYCKKLINSFVSAGAAALTNELTATH